MKLTYDKSMITEEYHAKAVEAFKALHNGTGEGNDFLGWLDVSISNEEIAKIKKAATKIRNSSDVLIVIGIGGSYLGARAAIEALSHHFFPKNVIFAGNNLSSDYMNDLLDFIKDKDVSLNVISKSGTTTEPAIAFNILKKWMDEKYGESAKERIYITTDKEKGILKEQADREGYETFVVPDDIGGRYSVLTAVGLLPIAAAGINIDKILEGARKAKVAFAELENNACLEYATLRNILYGQGKKIELLVNYEPKMHYFTEWWKQLFGESEGKEGKGIFPAGVDNTTDLHSMGQYIQEGERHLFETVIHIENPYRDIEIHCDEKKLQFLDGKTLNEVNRMAMQGTAIAHTNGKVPNLMVTIEKLDEESIGELIYFFEKSCGISGYMLGVNPFNQPGVEAYKKEMFRLLGKGE
ncbi:MAG: glucose-6-phosphate isomerase [Clostridia bacterium]|nr:glucose-6-phosphate isomerase [Clostridia bacterium]